MFRRRFDTKTKAGLYLDGIRLAAVINVGNGFRAIQPMNDKVCRPRFFGNQPVTKAGNVYQTFICKHQRIAAHAFTRTRRAYAEDHVVVVDGFDITPLVDGFGRDHLFAGGVKPRFGEIIAQTVSAVFGDLREDFAEFLIAKLVAFLKERGEIGENRFHCRHVFGRAVEGNPLPAHIYAHIKQRFEIFDILVVDAEERLQAAWRQFDFSHCKT